ncbi:hypothetical protein ElyMa_001873000 [Elysia marginata]|uniref:Reverse transcriptase domain-containing protein n=1 Tax=Elysia marginata TaxID=1093978 RepID=A0AAV4ENN8_9GAST|nr:hypothetical protein ElyMa_001873000 [Elysia marginata]
MRQADINDMGINIGGRDITNLRYADDTAILSDNLTSMKRILHRLNNAAANINPDDAARSQEGDPNSTEVSFLQGGLPSLEVERAIEGTKPSKCN